MPFKIFPALLALDNRLPLAHVSVRFFRSSATTHVRHLTKSDYILEEAKDVILPEEYRQKQAEVRASPSLLRRKARADAFDAEKARQKSLVPRIEKIEVKYEGLSGNNECALLMNKSLSTPYNVAQHISDTAMDVSALAMVNDKDIIDMHSPLSADCKLKFLTFHDDNPHAVNKAFWRSCSFMLGSVVETMFSDEYDVTLHSFPTMSVTSGSFVNDVSITYNGEPIEWQPTKIEMQAFSAAMHRLAEDRLPFHRLVVDCDIALAMFEHNAIKVGQIPSIAERNDGKVTVYKVGDHVDICSGPLIADSSFLGRRCSIVAAHPIVMGNRRLFRFQGVALPKSVFLNHFAFGILEKRAAELNPTMLDESPQEMQS